MSDERTELPWSRFVAIGDSFTEGVGDPEADSPGGLRGWADRFAEVLAEHNSDLAYANLAVRGKLIRQITDEQLEAAIDLRPDLVSVCAGGNDVIRFTAHHTLRSQLQQTVALAQHVGTDRAGAMIDIWHHTHGPDTWDDLAAAPADAIAYIELDDALPPAGGDLFVEMMDRRTFPGAGA